MRREGATITAAIDDDHKRLVEEIFGKEDTNRDGIISHAEFSGPKDDKEFEIEDTDAYVVLKRGQSSRDEL